MQYRVRFRKTILDLEERRLRLALAFALFEKKSPVADSLPARATGDEEISKEMLSPSNSIKTSTLEQTPKPQFPPLADQARKRSEKAISSDDLGMAQRHQLILKAVEEVGHE